jgi:hypothetical protein
MRCGSDMLRAGAMAAISACIAGCATTPVTTTVATTNSSAATAAASTNAHARTADGAPPTKPAAPLVIGAIEPATRGVMAQDLVRAPGTVAVYEVVDGARRRGSSKELLRERIEWREQPDGSAVLTRVEERDGRVVERMEFVHKPEGALDLARVDSITDRSRSEFATPLPFAADVASGAELAGESAMTVRTLPKLAKRAEGSARRALRIAGECTLSLRGEELRATVVEIEFDVSLDVAKARVRSRLFVVPGRGVVAEERSESRDVLAVFRSTSDETTVLVSVEEGPAAAPARPTP